MTVETHPLEPFLPEGATMLFLGSFPPPRERWSMEFFYPNFINDFWRVMGLVHFGDRSRFELPGRKAFDRDAIAAFASDAGLAFYDTATRVRRLKDNASDAFLEILEPTDVGALLEQLPSCRRIVTTGGKAGEELRDILERASGGKREIRQPAIGECLPLSVWGREVEWWRMPSTSRAYPLPLEKKAAFYRRLF
ncbi:MAG: uracil-DNA glycosylase family protein [Bacteroidales bacterium]|nr:uracil-DNA glycosylase family protein [Bacteroidales bacterium]